MAVLSLCFHTGQVLIVDWLAPGGSGVESTTLHIVTFDWQARFIKLRSPLQILAGYRARVRLGDWSGHGPAYMAIIGRVLDLPAHGAGVEQNWGDLPAQGAGADQLLSIFSEETSSVVAALANTYDVVVASPGVRKTSLVLPQKIQSAISTGGHILVLTPTTCARTQAVKCFRGHFEGGLRVLGSQKLSVEEEPLVLDALVADKLLPMARDVAAASARLLEEIEKLLAGEQHQVPQAHGVLINARERVEQRIPDASAGVVASRNICVATLGSLIGPSAPKTHRLPKNITFLAVDEAGVITAAEFVALLFHLSSHLDANCPSLSIPFCNFQSRWFDGEFNPSVLCIQCGAKF